MTTWVWVGLDFGVKTTPHFVTMADIADIADMVAYGGCPGGVWAGYRMVIAGPWTAVCGLGWGWAVGLDGPERPERVWGGGRWAPNALDLPRPLCFCFCLG